MSESDEKVKVHPMFLKFLRETGSLSKAMDLMHEWQMAHGGYVGCICTNNIYEAELEREMKEALLKEEEQERKEGKVREHREW